MSTYVLTWHPERWTWVDLAAICREIAAGNVHDVRWSAGNTKQIDIGSRVFLLRQGNDRPGFVGAGWTNARAYQGTHWDAARAAQGDQANYVTVAFEVLRDPASDPPLDWRTFDVEPAASAFWTFPASGVSIDANVARQLEELWAVHVGPATTLGTPGIVAMEGQSSLRLVKHRARERALRDARIRATEAAGALRCEAPGCGFDFAEKYGELGRGYAHVHHRRPLATMDGPTEVTLDDLAIVCANCHAMIHRGGECRALDTLIPDRHAAV